MHYPMIDTHQINFFCIFHFYFAVFVKLSKLKGLEIGKKLGQISHSIVWLALNKVSSLRAKKCMHHS